MSLIHDLMLVLPAFGIGVVFAGAVLAPRAYRRGRADAEEDQRVVDGVVALAGEDWPRPLSPRLTDPVNDLPMQLGTLSEHRRRLSLTHTPLEQARSALALAHHKALAAVAFAPAAPGRHRAENVGIALSGTVAQRRHSRAQEQQRIHLAWTTSTAEWPTVVEREGWQVGELVRS